MRRILPLVLAALLLLGIPLAAAAAELTACTVSAGSVAAKPGETVTVPVEISANPGFTNFAIRLDYDREMLTLVSLETSDGENPYLCGELAASNIAWTEDGEKTYGYVTCASDTAVTEDGVLFTAVFQLSETFEGTAAVTPEVVYMRNNTAVFSVFEEITAEAVSGSVTNLLPGDFDGSGAVDAIDVTQIYNAIRFDTALTDRQRTAADVNEDGEVDALDVTGVYNLVRFAE